MAGDAVTAVTAVADPGAVAYLAAGVLVLYGLTPLSTPQVLLEAPLGLQELALALWLILKGFAEPRGATSAPDDAPLRHRGSLR